MVYRVSGGMDLVEKFKTIRNHLYSMVRGGVEDKLPSEETGTFSIHNGPGDREIIQVLGWTGQGASPLWTKALEKSEKLHNIRQSYDRFLSGDLTLGELMRRLNQL